MLERDDRDRTPRLRCEHAADAAMDEPDRLRAVDALGPDDAQAAAPVEIDDVDPAAVGAQADQQIATRVRGDGRDRLGELVRARLPAIDARERVDARRLAVPRAPHDAIAAADRADRA